MSDDSIKNEDELENEEALEVAEDQDEVEEEEEEEDALTEEEMDEVDDLEKVEEEPEIGAIMVIGQGEFTGSESNRGADDPGDNTLSEPQWVTRYGDMLFVTDRGNHRALVWNQMPEENGEPSSFVLGQEDFSDCLENRGITTTLDEMTSGLGDENLEGFTISKAEEDTLSAPAGIAVIDGKLYLADSGNHRVLRWGGLPSEDGETPAMVLGQDNLECGEANRRGLVGSGSLFFPFAIRSGHDKLVFIADKDNHRILIWQKIPFGDGWNADVCLGQTDMDEREPNRGEFDHVTPDTLSFPTGVFYHDETGKLFVVDQGNNRVLIWNKLPSNNGVPADLVLGQKDFYSRTPNVGMGELKACAEGFFFPTDVVYGRKGLFISDSGNNRVLCWTEFPTENGQPPDVVIGQKTFYDNHHNRNQPNCSPCTLNDPYGLFLDEDLEDAEDPGKLYICDRSNSRIVVWEELPVTDTADEDIADENQPIFEESPELLMGSDDDFMDDDDEDDDDGGTPKEIA